MVRVQDPEKIGLFRLEDDGTLTFVGGRLVGGRLVVELHGFSRYVLAEVQVSFPNLEGHWARRDAELLAAKYVVRGRPDGRFDPGAPLTRAELAALVARLLGLRTAAGAGGPFPTWGPRTGLPPRWERSPGQDWWADTRTAPSGRIGS